MQILCHFIIDFKRLKTDKKLGRIDQTQEKILYRHDAKMEEFKRMAAHPRVMRAAKCRFKNELVLPRKDNIPANYGIGHRYLW